MLYNIVLVSAVQWSQSAVCTHTSPPFWASIPPTCSNPPPYPNFLGHHKWLSWAPSSLQYVLTNYLSPTWSCIYVNTNFPVRPTLYFPCGAHMSFVYICLTIPALQIVSFVPFFQIPYIWKNKLNRCMGRNFLKKDILKQSQDINFTSSKIKWGMLPFQNLMFVIHKYPNPAI